MMSKQTFKVGDEVLVRLVIESDVDSDGDLRLIPADNMNQGVVYAKPNTVSPATRAQWDVLREAATVVNDHHGALALQDLLRLEADRLEAAARPPSLLEAAKAVLAEMHGDAKMLRDLRAAVAAAEKEQQQ